MTVTDDINAMTGNSFNSTLVSSAKTTAETIISGLVNETYTAGNEKRLDTAVALIAVQILEKGKVNQTNLTQRGAILTSPDIITPEIQTIIELYKADNTGGWVFDNTISSNDYFQ